jgi:hypothetical protein
MDVKTELIGYSDAAGRIVGALDDIRAQIKVLAELHPGRMGAELLYAGIVLDQPHTWNAAEFRDDVRMLTTELSGKAVALQRSLHKVIDEVTATPRTRR